MAMNDQIYWGQLWQQYLRVQNKAAALKLLPLTSMFQRGMMGRRFAAILRFSRGMADRKRGNMSEPSEEREVLRTHHIATRTHSRSTRAPKSWTDCWEACCLTETVIPLSARHNQLQQKHQQKLQITLQPLNTNAICAICKLRCTVWFSQEFANCACAISKLRSSTNSAQHIRDNAYPLYFSNNVFILFST